MKPMHFQIRYKVLTKYFDYLDDYSWKQKFSIKPPYTETFYLIRSVNCLSKNHTLHVDILQGKITSYLPKILKLCLKSVSVLLVVNMKEINSFSTLYNQVFIFLQQQHFITVTLGSKFTKKSRERKRLLMDGYF